MTTHNTEIQLRQRIRQLEAEKQGLQEMLRRTRSSEQMHRLTLENIADTVLITDDDGRFVYVCPNTSNIFGLTKKEVFELDRIDALIDGTVCEPSELKQIGIKENIEWAVTDRSGEVRLVLITAKSVKIENGTILYVIREITPYLQIQKQLQESELKYRNLINSLPGTAYQFVLSAAGEFRFEFMGENCRRLFGCEADDILADARLVFDLIPSPDAEKVQAAIQRSADTMQPYEVKHRVVKKTGETLWIHAVSIPRRLPSGETIWDGIGLDDTQRRLSEEAQQRSYHELKLREAIANLFLTSPKERLFSDIHDRLRTEFDCHYGYIGYIDEKGDLCCPSLTRDSGEECRMRDKSAVFPEKAWAGLWGDSLKQRRPLRKNTGLTPPPGHVSLANALVVPMLVNDQLVGQVGLANKPTGFLAADQKQLEALCEFLAPIMYLYLEKERHYEALQRSAIKLAEKNTALNVLLDNRAEEQKKTADNIMLNFERLVLPYFEKLKATSSRETIATILDIVSANTRESLAPLEKSVSVTYRSFSPMEIQVADLVKSGRTSKQIAAILNISTRSVYFHRNNIRRKLGIHNTNTNLGTALRNLPTAS